MQIWRIKDIHNICTNWQREQFDGLIVFDGARGLGKSTGAIRLCKKQKGFKMKEGIVFKRDDVMNLLTKKKNEFILADEMINVTYNRDFYAEGQKQMLKLLNMYRDSCNILVSCVPNFYDLDKQFRSLCKMRINVIRRGLAVVHTPNQTSYSADKWDMAVNEKIERKWVQKGKDFRPNYSRLTTARAYLKYQPLPKKTQEIYDNIKQSKRNLVFVDEEQESKEKTLMQKLYEMAKQKELTKEILTRICKLNDLKYNYVVANMNNRLKNDGVKNTLSFFLLADTDDKSTKSLTSKNLMNNQIF